MGGWRGWSRRARLGPWDAETLWMTTLLLLPLLLLMVLLMLLVLERLLMLTMKAGSLRIRLVG